RIIRLNLLCNPTGKPNAFRAVDWLVERNNLYTKVIFAGTGPNRTIDHIIKQSPLIEVFRNCHVIMENAFYLKNRTIRHTHPDMAATIEKLRSHIQSTSSYMISQNRSAKRVIEDQIAVGMKLIQQKKVSLTMSSEDRYEAEAEDFNN
ncbi:uncharacterized protein HD556DRAFT_1249371, partial [Suillus plorans]